MFSVPRVHQRGQEMNGSLLEVSFDVHRSPHRYMFSVPQVRQRG